MPTSPLRFNPSGPIEVADAAGRIHKLPDCLPGLSRRGERRGIELIAAWKRLHSLCEGLYEKYRDLLEYMVRSLQAADHGSIEKAAQYQLLAQTHLSAIRGHNGLFCRELETLPRALLATRMIQSLLSIAYCPDAIMRTLATPPGNVEFQRGARLTELVRDWLFEALHRADKILEKYFQEVGEGC